MFRELTTIALCLLTIASCSKDEASSKGHGSALDGFKVGTSRALPVPETSTPEWLLPVPACPADSLPQHFQESDFDLQACSGAAVAQCIKECQGNKAASCYASALVLQGTGRPDEQNTATALFSRACQLGDASGCTNWAASLDEESNADCVHRTFEATCRRGHDPWGCTMHARALVLGSNGEPSIDAVKELLADACRLGQDDPACEGLKTIIANLDEPTAMRDQ